MFIRRSQGSVPGALPYNFGDAEVFTPAGGQDGKMYRFKSKHGGSTTTDHVNF
jgi:hypothetical protein